MRKIGEKWGPVLSIDNKIDEVCSLTYAKMIVRTKAQNKIDGRIRLQFEHGSCDVWIKECSWHEHKQRRTGLDCKANSNGSHIDKSDPRNPGHKSGNIALNKQDWVDPILDELMNTPAGTNEQKWVDPIVVDETVGWRTVQTEGVHSQSSQLDMVLTDRDISNPTHNQPKTPRGRPRKKRNQQYESPLPYFSNSSLEALNTWNTAKLLGISSSDEVAVVSGLRKSKRLQIMDGKST